MARGDLVRQFKGMVSEKTLESLQEFEDIHEGRKPNRVSEDPGVTALIGFNPGDAGRRLEAAAMEPRAEEVPAVDWEKVKGSASAFTFYHYDLAQLFVGRRHPFFASFKTALFNPPMPPLLRVMFPGPIFAGGKDPAIFGSMLAMERGDMAERFKSYIVSETFTRRRTSAEKAKGKKDEYWELVCYPRRMNIDGAKFVMHLYLPAGLEYTMVPRVGMETGRIEVCFANPLEHVIKAGRETLLGGNIIV